MHTAYRLGLHLQFGLDHLFRRQQMVERLIFGLAAIGESDGPRAGRDSPTNGRQVGFGPRHDYLRVNGLGRLRAAGGFSLLATGEGGSAISGCRIASGETTVAFFRAGAACIWLGQAIR